MHNRQMKNKMDLQFFLLEYLKTHLLGVLSHLGKNVAQFFTLPLGTDVSSKL